MIFDAFVVLFLIFLATQIFLPPFIGKKIFWLFRPSVNAANPEEKEIKELEQEKERLNQKKRKIELKKETGELNRKLDLEEIKTQQEIDNLDKKINKKKSAKRQPDQKGNQTKL